MVELWETSMMWRILINLFGAVSIIIGIWIIVRLFKQISLRMRKGKGFYYYENGNEYEGDWDQDKKNGFHTPSSGCLAWRKYLLPPAQNC